MCFGTQAAVPDNPAPYSLADSYQQVKETARSAGSSPLSAAAAAKDAQDKPTAAVTGASVTTGLQTATL